MNIEEAIDEFAFFNEGDYITRKMSIAKDVILDNYKDLAFNYEKEKEKNKELESDIQQKNFEIKCLNSDIKNMYCEEGVIAILEDNFNLSREEAINILREE